MTYEIFITRDPSGVSTIDVIVMNGAEEIIKGQISVMITEENLVDSNGNVLFESIDAAARDYAENIFLPDLRRNFRSLKDLTLPCDSQG